MCYGFQWLYRLAVEEVPEDDYMLPLSEAEVSPYFMSFKMKGSVFNNKYDR